MKAFLTIGLGNKRLGDLELELFNEVVPLTVKNFVSQLEKNFKGCKFHRIIKNFMAQGGDFTRGDGTGGESIYGKAFDDENFIRGHDHRGMLSMANSGPNTNGSQFFITFRPTPHLNGKHVVFGRVVAGLDILTAMENVSTGRNDVPKLPMVILDCGLIQAKSPTQPQQPKSDENEIDLDEGDAEEGPTKAEPNGDEIDLPDDDDEDQQEDVGGKKGSLKDRLRKLKMKMNQARQLNRREVMREGERLGSKEGKAKERQRQSKEDKSRKLKEWESNNARALKVAADAGIDGKFVVDQAGQSIVSTNSNSFKRAIPQSPHDIIVSQNRAMRKEEKNEMNRFSVKDYHNPEGQYRNYERNIKSLPKTLDRKEVSTYDPLSAATSNIDQKAGAKRLANELKARIEKQKSKRGRNEYEGADVNYINQRNKRFNEKISRNYDKPTAEIRQNLERGTAL